MPGRDLGNGKLTAEALHMPDGARLPLHRWPVPDGTAAKAVFLGVHGFNDYGHAFFLPGRWWAARGIEVYAYDQRGFGGAPHPGRWAGAGRLTRDLAQAVELIRTRHPGIPLYLMGVSMGGAVILAAAETGILPTVSGVILAAPAVWARSTMPFYQRWALWLGARTVPWLTLTGEGLDRWPTDNMAVLHAMSRDPKVIKATRVDAMYGLTNLMDTALNAGASLPEPALLLYGAQDQIVPPAPMHRFWCATKGRQAVTRAYYPNGYHMLLRDQQALTVWRDVAAWIEAPGTSLPSGQGQNALPRLLAAIGGEAACHDD